MYLANYERPALGLGAYGCDAPVDVVTAAVTALAPPADAKGPLARLVELKTTGFLPGEKPVSPAAGKAPDTTATAVTAPAAAAPPAPEPPAAPACTPKKAR